jgi:hypothetical protein
MHANCCNCGDHEMSDTHNLKVDGRAAEADESQKAIFL